MLDQADFVDLPLTLWVMYGGGFGELRSEGYENRVVRVMRIVR